MRRWIRNAVMLAALVPLLQYTVVCDVPRGAFFAPVYRPYDYVIVEETVIYDDYFYGFDCCFGSFWDFWWF